MASVELRDRLQGLLLDTPSISSPEPRPLIQVIGSDEGKTAKRGLSSGRSDADLKSSFDDVGDYCDDADEGDDPPPIFSFSADRKIDTKSETASSHNHSISVIDHIPGAPSLAEQMLVDAALAKEERQKQQSQREKLTAKRSTFGMKRGFLNSTLSKTNRKEKSATQNASNHKPKAEESKADAGHPGNGKQDELIYELDSDGNIIPSSSSIISDDHQSQGRSPLHLTEVQSAMLSQLETNANLWARPDLLATITKHHPKLARGMNDPRYISALQGMQTHPKETLENLKNNCPEILDWLQEFCGVMGEHFIRLGEEQDGMNNNRVKRASDANATKVRELGPLEKKALEKHMNTNTTKDQRPQRNNNADTSTTDMDERVSSILANDELRSILMDPIMQQIMEECSTGNKLRYYMSHAEHGPKLRKLFDAGLIRVA